MKIGILTDSASDLAELKYDYKNIKILPFRIIYKDVEYRDRVDISPNEIYAKLEEEIPKTSLPSGQDITDAFEEFKNEGYTHVLGVFISANLSGTFNQIKNISLDFPEIEYVGFDTRELSLAEGLMVLTAAKMVEEGKTIREIADFLEEDRKRYNTQFVLDTLEYLIKGGRIGKVAGTIGQLLNLKPIIHVNDEGIYHTLDKGRGKVLAKQKLISILNDYFKDGNSFNLYVVHGGAEEEAKEFFNQIKSMNNPKIQNMHFAQTTPSLGVHTGKGLIGLITEKLS